MFNGPDDGAAAGAVARSTLAWYVLFAKRRKEASAELHLRRRGVEVFFPQLVLPAYTSARDTVPLFPNYLFVRVDVDRQFNDVVWAPGVSRFVGPSGVPTPIGDDVVDFLRRNASADGRIPARSAFRTGQEIEIVAGPFAGLVGLIERPPDAKGRIRVLMQLLNRRLVNVQVPAHYVKSSWVA